MKKFTHYFFLIGFVLIIFGSWVLSSGGSPGGKTGSPGDGGASCTDCHTGTPQQAENWISSDIPNEGYSPGQTYTITAMGSHNGVGKFGFEATAEDDSGEKVGALVVTDAAQTKLVNNNNAVTHTSAGTTPDGNDKTWNFDWTAPEGGTGDVTFYASFNAADGKGSTSGDVIYLSSSTFPENTGSGINDGFAYEADLKIFPNPASDFVDLSWNGSDYVMKEVKIYSLNGSEVGSVILSSNQDGRCRMPLNNINPGLYLIRMVSLDGQQASLSLLVK
jgi:hypothetical protein